MLRVILRAATQLHPEPGLGSWARRLRFMGRAVVCRRLVRRWVAAEPAGSLGADLRDRPGSLGIVVWPYINKDWEAPRRFDAVFEHHEAVGQLPLLQLRLSQSRELFDLEDVFPGLRVVLDRAPWFQREGELVLNLFVREERVYSVAFSLGRHEGLRVAFVGGVQGRDIEGIGDLYKAITKKLHGARPRDFLITVLQLVCEAAGVEAILGVGDAHRHHRHPYFAANGQQTPSADYDEIWRDRGGTPLHGTGFIRVPARWEARREDEVPANKRAVYRRRNELYLRLQQSLLVQMVPGPPL
jgi:uncharacterized protein